MILQVPYPEPPDTSDDVYCFAMLRNLERKSGRLPPFSSNQYLKSSRSDGVETDFRVKAPLNRLEAEKPQSLYQTLRRNTEA